MDVGDGREGEGWRRRLQRSTVRTERSGETSSENSTFKLQFWMLVSNVINAFDDLCSQVSCVAIAGLKYSAIISPISPLLEAQSCLRDDGDPQDSGVLLGFRASGARTVFPQADGTTTICIQTKTSTYSQRCFCSSEVHSIANSACCFFLCPAGRPALAQIA
jgi:hypothetical protein